MTKEWPNKQCNSELLELEKQQRTKGATNQLVVSFNEIKEQGQ